MRRLLLLIGFWITTHTQGQILHFQKFIDSAAQSFSSLRVFDGVQGSNGSYYLNAIARIGNNDRALLMKLDCAGKVISTIDYGGTSSINNIFGKVMRTSDGGIIYLNNLGNFNAYNILVSKIDANDNVQWRKIINNGLSNDQGQSIQQTLDGGYIIAGKTSSFGANKNDISSSDAYFIKLSGSGNIEWTRTIGRNDGIDDAKDIVQISDSSYMYTGTILSRECFNISLGKLDQNGFPLWQKVYGDTLSRNGGYNIAVNSQNEIFIFGSTSLHNPSPSFSGDISHLLMKTDSTGNLLWQRVFNGSNNGSDNSLSMYIDMQSNIILGTETMSFPSIGFTPNKQVGYRYSDSGNLIAAIGYNQTGSQYTRIKKTINNGASLSGFGTINSPANQRGYCFKLDSILHVQCNENDLTSLVTQHSPVIFQWNELGSIDSGATLQNHTASSNLLAKDTTLCLQQVPLNPNFTYQDTCFSDTTLFSANPGSLYYSWVIDADTIISTNPYLEYVFATAGVHNVSLFVTDGCGLVASSKIIKINGATSSITASNINPSFGEIVTLTLTPPTAKNISWQDGSTTLSISTSTSGEYYCSYTIDGCPYFDTIELLFAPPIGKGSVFIPNVITPNNDKLNDELTIYTTGKYIFKSIKIYNRWGQKVFESSDKNLKFNGRYKGENSGNENFYYQALFEISGVEEIFKGDILVVK
jgi:gliding motility-associated-like protein